MSQIVINSAMSLSPSEIRVQFARSGGPGGQNVNKVETRVEVLFDVRNSPSLDDDQRARILHALASRIDREGVLHVSAQESRSQFRNRERAVEKLVELLRKALQPKKKRRATKAPAASRELRLRTKKRRSEIKRMRRVTE